MKKLPPRFFRLPATAFFVSFTTSVSAGSYTFTNIIDTSGIFSDFGSPSINESGTVGFLASLDAGGSGIYRSAGGAPTPIAVSGGGTFTSFGSGGTPINDAGKVAFIGGPVGGGDGIFVGDGATTTTIALGDHNPFVAFLLQEPLSINASGTVAFESSIAGGSLGIFTGSGGPTTTLYTNSDPMFSGFGVPISINDSGTAAFGAILDAGGSGVFSGNGGSPASIALSTGPFTSLAGSQLAINAAGTVVFVGGLDSGTAGIFTGSGDATTAVVTTHTPFATFNFPSINSSGAVVFLANLTSGNVGIYNGPDAVANRIIHASDPLFGSTVNGIRLSTNALNDTGQVAFFYSLTDGRHGIAVATPPPSLFILSITQLSDGSMHLVVQGAPNLSHVIQATPDLVQPFQSIGTETAASDGTFSFDDTNAPGFSTRFYRAMLP